MPARYTALSHCIERREHVPLRRRQQGAALLLALFTVALATMVASAITTDFGKAVDIVSGRHDLAQARLLARGAIDWGCFILAQDARNSTIDYAGELWTRRIPPTPVEEGEVAGELSDMSGRFDLNSLVSDKRLDRFQTTAYIRLLESLGIGTDQAVTLAQALARRIGAQEDSPDPDPDQNQSPQRLPANRYLVDVAELPLIPGYDAKITALLAPYVAAFPDPALLNVNMASAEVLAAMVPGLSRDTARVLVAQREAQPFRTIEEFMNTLPSGSRWAINGRITVASRYFLASGRARFGESTVQVEALLDRKNPWPTILWQKLL
ncbi:MAG: type II secretion system minor pseudopilin GspK [Proteobacteria bacterium]|nr:type II secretion system minor pseudopilin GspK [Pseudomonadota bacterium]HQR02577.1 type II secretion system minor pseudopilin GspK [Rhodocyclaceae bacterium]